MSDNPENPSTSALIFFQAEDRLPRIQVRLEGGTVWLTQAQMAELYQSSVPNINLHLKAVYEETELTEAATIKRYLIVRREGKREVSREVIHQRADASQPFMGLTHVRPGGVLRKSDVSVAKNYLQPDELEALNRIVNAYLEFAELQASGRKPMQMAGWIGKLDDFLRISDREILTHAGKISHEMAQLKSEGEFAKFRALADAQPQPVDKDFDEAVEKLKKLSAAKPGETKS